MKRTHKKSTITFMAVENLEYVYPLQIECVPNCNDYVIAEYLISEDVINEYVKSADATPEKNIVDIEYENALTTVLNNDPQGKYSGRTLEEIFNDPNGAQWVDWALKNMHNKFILDRVKIIYNKRGAK